jgi:hypothetical protein
MARTTLPQNTPQTYWESVRVLHQDMDHPLTLRMFRRASKARRELGMDFLSDLVSWRVAGTLFHFVNQKRARFGLPVGEIRFAGILENGDGLFRVLPPNSRAYWLRTPPYARHEGVTHWSASC